MSIFFILFLFISLTVVKCILNIIELHLIRHYNEIILGLSDCEDVLPIYIGDDRTDEDAFKVKFRKAMMEMV